MMKFRVNLVFSFLILIATVAAHSADHVLISADTLWCVDGTFKLNIEQSGIFLPAPVDNCLVLNSAGVLSPQIINLKVTSSQPVGNLFLYFLKNILKVKSPNLNNYPLSKLTNYAIRQGSCNESKFFIVERDVNIPYLPAANLNLARLHCRIETAQRRLNSNLALEGVYPRQDGQSLDNFVSSLVK